MSFKKKFSAHWRCLYPSVLEFICTQKRLVSGLWHKVHQTEQSHISTTWSFGGSTCLYEASVIFSTDARIPPGNLRRRRDTSQPSALSAGTATTSQTKPREGTSNSSVRRVTTIYLRVRYDDWRTSVTQLFSRTTKMAAVDMEVCYESIKQTGRYIFYR